MHIIYIYIYAHYIYICTLYIYIYAHYIYIYIYMHIIYIYAHYIYIYIYIYAHYIYIYMHIIYIYMHIIYIYIYAHIIYIYICICDVIDRTLVAGIMIRFTTVKDRNCRGRLGRCSRSPSVLRKSRGERLGFWDSNGHHLLTGLHTSMPVSTSQMDVLDYSLGQKDTAIYKRGGWILA